MSMAESKKPAAPKHIIDVTHADKTAPSDTSRPVIVTNRPILKDPMMSETSSDPELSPPAAATPATEEGSDKPKTLSFGEKVVAPTAANETEIPAKSAPATKPAASEAQPADASANTDAETPPDTSRGALSKDPAASDDIEASQQAEHEAEVQKLIESKQYYLPIETTEHRRSRRFVALGVVLSLVLAVAWGDIALDANLIQLHGVKPLTHFFTN